MNGIKLSWKNIIHRPLASSLSLLLLASGISIILVTLLSYRQINEKFNNNAGQVDLVIGAKGSRLQMVLCNVFHVDQPTGNINYARTGFLRMHPFVEKAIPLSLGDNYKSYRIVGTTPDYIDLYGGEMAEGEIWTEPLQVVIGDGIANKLGLKLGDTFIGGHGLGESTHSHDEFAYTVVGILKRSNTVLDNLLLTDFKSVWIVHAGHGHEDEGSFDLVTQAQKDSLSLLEPTSDTVGEIQVPAVEEQQHDHGDHEHKEHGHEEHAHDDHGHDHDHHHGHHHEEIDFDEILKSMDPKTREVTSVLVTYKSTRGRFTIPGIANNTEGLMAAEPAIEILQLTQLLEPAIGVMGMMAIFIMIIAAVSMFISMFNSLKDRQYEIALLRVMGASSVKVFGVILLEGILLSVMGYVFGILISHIGMEMFSGYLSETYHYDFTGWMWIKEEWWILLGAVVLGMVSALYPAFRAYKTDISETLSK